MHDRARKKRKALATNRLNYLKNERKRYDTKIRDMIKKMIVFQEKEVSETPVEIDDLQIILPFYNSVAKRSKQPLPKEKCYFKLQRLFLFEQKSQARGLPTFDEDIALLLASRCIFREEEDTLETHLRNLASGIPVQIDNSLSEDESQPVDSAQPDKAEDDDNCQPKETGEPIKPDDDANCTKNAPSIDTDKLENGITRAPNVFIKRGKPRKTCKSVPLWKMQENMQRLRKQESLAKSSLVSGSQVPLDLVKVSLPTTGTVVSNGLVPGSMTSCQYSQSNVSEYNTGTPQTFGKLLPTFGTVNGRTVPLNMNQIITGKYFDQGNSFSIARERTLYRFGKVVAPQIQNGRHPRIEVEKVDISNPSFSQGMARDMIHGKRNYEAKIQTENGPAVETEALGAHVKVFSQSVSESNFVPITARKSIRDKYRYVKVGPNSVGTELCVNKKLSIPASNMSLTTHKTNSNDFDLEFSKMLNAQRIGINIDRNDTKQTKHFAQELENASSPFRSIKCNPTVSKVMKQQNFQHSGPDITGMGASISNVFKDVGADLPKSARTKEQGYETRIPQSLFIDRHKSLTTKQTRLENHENANPQEDLCRCFIRTEEKRSEKRALGAKPFEINDLSLAEPKPFRDSPVDKVEIVHTGSDKDIGRKATPNNVKPQQFFFKIYSNLNEDASGNYKDDSEKESIENGTRVPPLIHEEIPGDMPQIFLEEFYGVKVDQTTSSVSRSTEKSENGKAALEHLSREEKDFLTKEYDADDESEMSEDVPEIFLEEFCGVVVDQTKSRESRSTEKSENGTTMKEHLLREEKDFQTNEYDADNESELVENNNGACGPTARKDVPKCDKKTPSSFDAVQLDEHSSASNGKVDEVCFTKVPLLNAKTSEPLFIAVEDSKTWENANDTC